MATDASKKLIHTYRGDGAFAYMHDTLMRPFLKRTAGDRFDFDEFDWSAYNRVKTDGVVIRESVEASKAEQAAVVKYPGATPNKEELDHLQELTGKVPKTALGLGNSPNAPLRGANGFDASIVRTPARSSALVEPLKTHWSKKSAVEIHSLTDGGRGANRTITITNREQDVEMVFIDAQGTEHILKGADGDSFHLQSGSPISVTHVDRDEAEKAIRASLDKAVKQKADVLLSLKDTVLKSVDAPLKKLAEEIYQTDYKAKFHDNGQHFGYKLVDDGFAWLLSEASGKDKRQIMLSPDDMYGRQMGYVLNQVKEHGLNYDHTKHPVAVARFSNGVGDEYGAMHFPGVDKQLNDLVKHSGGTLVVRDKHSKDELYREKVAAGQNMWMLSAQDVGAAHTYAKRMIMQALNQGQVAGKPLTRLVFGFDKDSPYEGVFAAAIEEEITKHRTELEAKGITAEVKKPEIAAAESLTDPSEKGTLLALNNLWGDIIADLYPALANNRASYDSVLISDKGFVVETGSGGTAPDLLFGRDGEGGLVRTGKFDLNPIAILSSYAQTARYNGDAVYADALEHAIDRTLRQGYLTADLVNKNGSGKLRAGLFKQGEPGSLDTPRAVDTRIFMKAVEVNVLEALGKDTAQAKQALDNVKNKDSIPLTQDEIKALALYATKPGDTVMGNLQIKEVRKLHEIKR